MKKRPGLYLKTLWIAPIAAATALLLALGGMEWIAGGILILSCLRVPRTVVTLAVGPIRRTRAMVQSE